MKKEEQKPFTHMVSRKLQALTKKRKTQIDEQLLLYKTNPDDAFNALNKIYKEINAELYDYLQNKTGLIL